MSRPLKVAIAHDYLTQRGGAEKVVLAMARAFPDAPIYTTLYDPKGTYPEFRDLDIRTSKLNRIGFFRQNHRAALPLLPFVSSSMKIDADVVLTSSSGWAHGFRTRGKKIVYCHSPARWLYQSDVYLGLHSSSARRLGLRLISPVLRLWDLKAADSAHTYFANSSIVKRRVESTYSRYATVLPAPHGIGNSLGSEPVSEIVDWARNDVSYYLCISRLLPYKNVDKVVEAFRGSARRLVIVGSGPQESELARIRPPNVRMVKDLTDEQISWLYTHCNGLVAASYEDYGLTPLEAAAHGKPVAVLRWGGYLDTVSEGVTGVYFDEPAPKLIEEAVRELEKISWSEDAFRLHLDQFSEERFARELSDAVHQPVGTVVDPRAAGSETAIT